MSDTFALQAEIALDFNKLKAQLPQIKRMVSDALKVGDVAKGSSSSAGGGGMLSGLGKMLAPLVGIAGGIALLVSSSGALRAALSGVLQTVQLIVRPIGDLLAIGLMPIIAILRPIGMFFKILLAPYIQNARTAMQLGRQLQSKGDYTGAAAAYGLGVTYLLKPFFDMFVTGFTILTETIAGIIKGLGDLIIGVFNKFGILDSLKTSWDNIMNGAIERIAAGGVNIINTTNNWMGQQLASLNLEWESVKNLADVKMTDYGKVIGSGFINIINATTDYMTGTSDSMTAAITTGFVEGAIPATVIGMTGVTGVINTQWCDLKKSLENSMRYVDTSLGYENPYTQQSVMFTPTISTAPTIRGGMGSNQTINMTNNITVPKTNMTPSDFQSVLDKYSNDFVSKMRCSGH